jgi:hypothetical protein
MDYGSNAVCKQRWFRLQTVLLPFANSTGLETLIIKQC